MEKEERFEKEFKPARQRLAKGYHEMLSSNTCLELFPDEYDSIVPHIFPIKVKKNNRDGLRQYLLDKNIEVGIHYYPNHFLTYYGARKGICPNAERLYNELLTLPLHPGLTDKEQEIIVENVLRFLG